MRKPILLAVVAVLVGAMYFFAPKSDTTGEQAQSLVAAGALLVDVRSPEEFQAGHIPGARNVPIDALGARMSELGPQSTPIVVYCHSGGRSAQAQRLLRDAGFSNVHNLGAMSAWPAN